MELPIKKKESIKTERLTLMPYRREDIDALARLLMNEEITKTFMVPDFSSPEEAKSLAEKLCYFSRIEDEKHLEYGIYLFDKLIGFINDCGIEEDEIEVGYVIDPSEKGKGYATEALKAVISELREMGFRKVKAGYFKENTSSLRVMEKCGMKKLSYSEEEEYRGKKHLCHYCEISF